MYLCKYITRASIMDGLIQAKTTGPARQFAKTMQLTEPHLRRHIKTMIQMGFPVKYSRRYNSYCYEAGMLQILLLRYGKLKYVSANNF